MESDYAGSLEPIDCTICNLFASRHTSPQKLRPRFHVSGCTNNCFGKGCTREAGSKRWACAKKKKEKNTSRKHRCPETGLCLSSGIPANCLSNLSVASQMPQTATTRSRRPAPAQPTTADSKPIVSRTAQAPTAARRSDMDFTPAFLCGRKHARSPEDPTTSKGIEPDAKRRRARCSKLSDDGGPGKGIPDEASGSRKSSATTTATGSSQVDESRRGSYGAPIAVRASCDAPAQIPRMARASPLAPVPLLPIEPPVSDWRETSFGAFEPQSAALPRRLLASFWL